MVLHQIVDVLILSFLDLMHLYLQAKIQLLLKVLQFLLIVGYELLFGGLQSQIKVFESGFEVFLLVLDLHDALHLVSLVLFGLVPLLIPHLFLLLLVKSLLLGHGSLGRPCVTSNVSAVQLMLVLNVLDLLDVNFDLSAVGLFSPLHL